MKVSVGNKVVLIGAGDVGLAYSYALINQGVLPRLVNQVTAMPVRGLRAARAWFSAQ